MTNKVVVITGAAGGIGRATALELTRQGYRLALADLDAAGLSQTVAEVEALGGKPLACELNVADGAAQQALAQRCREELGQVDVLVNNAGIVRLGPFAELDEADWRALFEVNLLGVVLGVKAFLPLLEQSRGQIVNIGSGTSLLPFPGFAAYGTLKVSILWLSEYLAAELAEQGIAVTCICPLLVRSGISAAIQQDAARQPSWLYDPPERVARQIARAIRRRPFLVYGAVGLRLLHWLHRAAPWLTRWVARRLTRGQLARR